MHQLVKAPIVLVWNRRPAVKWPATKAAEDTGFADSYPEAHPDPASGPGHTWSPVRPVHQYGSGRPEPQDRIDFVLHRGLTVRDARTLVTGTPRPWLDESGNDCPSGHAAVVTTFGQPRRAAPRKWPWVTAGHHCDPGGDAVGCAELSTDW